MDKPITVLRQELINTIADAINSSGLSPVLIVPILKDMLAEAQLAMQRQYEIEKAQYEAAISKISE